MPRDNTSVTQPFHLALAVVPIRGAVLCAIRNATLFVDVWVMFFEFLRIGAAHVSRDPVVLLFLNGRTCFDCVTAYQKSWERRLGEPSRRISV